MPVLLLAGSGGSLASMRAATVVPVGDGVIIGRRAPPVADGHRSLILPDKSVSSLHARIVKIADHAGVGAGAAAREGFEIQDLNSTNGTFVDGRQIAEATPLHAGSVIFIGAQVLVFRLVTPAELLAIEEDVRRPFAPVPTLSPMLALVCSKLRRLAPSGSEIFLLGETGVGKEVFARAVHEQSGRAGALVAINCAAIPRELVESELFGYEKGAHSTAQARKTGFIEAAQGGTLFLDELGEMPLEIQSKLLRFLQDRRFSPLGSTRVQEADVRIIAASSRTAMAKGASGNIQAALLGRLGAQPIQLPALRDRIEDLGRLASFFLDDRPVDQDQVHDQVFETEAFHALFLHDWPHNIRELQKVISEAELLSAGAPAIAFEHLPESVTSSVEASGDLPDGAPEPGAGGGVPHEVTGESTGKTGRIRRPPPSPEELTSLLGLYQGNVADVARHLSRQYAVVWRCIQRYGISAEQFRPLKPDGAGETGEGGRVADDEEEAPAGEAPPREDDS